jgi:hypothetical protein
MNNTTITWTNSEELFANLGSKDILGFEFNKRSYGTELFDAEKKTGRTCAITCWLREGKIGIT